MINNIKKTTLKLSIVAALAITPSAVLGASGAGFIEGSSESSSAMLEQPNFEGQLVRINTGINLVRINTDILTNMPVSENSEWVDKVVGAVDYKAVTQMPAVKNDAYYSTVGFTNLILNRPTVILSPLGARLFHQAAVIYKEVPDMNEFPDISNIKSFLVFQNVDLIDVEATTGNLYPNVEEATISLLPEDMQEETRAAQKEYREATIELLKGEEKAGTIEVWLEADENENSPEIAQKEEELKIAEKEVEELKAIHEAKEEIYFKTLEDGALALESNYDSSKLPLAKKLEKLLDAVDNNAIGAGSMFVSAVAGLTRGIGMVGDELQAMTKASGLHPAFAAAIKSRIKRMGVGAVMALPNIGIGTYYAAKQAGLAGEYQQVVRVIIAAGEAEAEAAKAAEEAANTPAEEKPEA